MFQACPLLAQTSRILFLCYLGFYFSLQHKHMHTCQQQHLSTLPGTSAFVMPAIQGCPGSGRPWKNLIFIRMFLLPIGRARGHAPLLEGKATNFCRGSQKTLVVYEPVSCSPVPAHRIREEEHRYSWTLEISTKVLWSQEEINLILVFGSDDPLLCNSISVLVGLGKDEEVGDFLFAPSERFGDSFTSTLQDKMGNKVLCQGNTVPVTFALCTRCFPKAQLWTYPVVLTVTELCSNFIRKGSMEIILSNSQLPPGPTPRPCGVAHSLIQSSTEYLCDEKHSAFPVQHVM